MKLKVGILLFTFLGFQSYSQNEEWYTYDLDSIVSLNMPRDVYESDTIVNTLRQYAIFSQNDSVSYYARKIRIEKEFYQLNGIQSPSQDPKSLTRFYQTFALLTSEMRNQENSISRPINFDQLKGYRFVLDATKEYPYLESQMVFVNDNMYIFQYANQKGLDSVQRNTFFDSIYFDDAYELKQFKKKRTFLNATTIGILLIFLLISFYLKEKNKRWNRDQTTTNFH